MKKFQLLIVLSIALLLVACGGKDEEPREHGSVNDGEAVNKNGALDHGIDDKKIGFSLTGETIEEVENVPAEEKEKILDVFAIYIDAFNDKDVDAYMATLSEHTESFDLEEERAYMAEVFGAYDLDREASDITIVKYTDTEVQVFATLQTYMKQISTGLETNPSGRQVTVFTKDEGEWKVASVHYIGDETKQ